MEAMLEACGERGYRNVTVQDVIDRYGGSRHEFYAHFPNKVECYADAYEFEIELRYETLMEILATEDTWAKGLLQALRQTAALLHEQPALARGLFVEVHVAGGRARRKRAEMITRLTQTLDQARGGHTDTDTDNARPSVTAAFMLGSIRCFVTGAIVRGAPQDFATEVRGLSRLVLSAFPGPESAATSA
jgi:AcrR family transcriptional regulator